MRRLWQRSQASEEVRNEFGMERDQAIRSVLWHSENKPEADGISTLLAQYGLYVESAEKVSQKRSTANNYFLLVNSAGLAALTAFGFSGKKASAWLLLFSALVMIGVCYLWASVVSSYRQLNGAKWSVVIAMEKRLACAPWTAEWLALGEGRDPSVYRQLTGVEKWVPRLFAVVYAVGFAMLAVLR